MRIEKLNKDKIKVTLTTAELINLDIDVKRLSPDSKELHTFLFHIMETIREETVLIRITAKWSLRLLRHRTV